MFLFASNTPNVLLNVVKNAFVEAVEQIHFEHTDSDRCFIYEP